MENPEAPCMRSLHHVLAHPKPALCQIQLTFPHNHLPSKSTFWTLQKAGLESNTTTATLRDCETKGLHRVGCKVVKLALNWVWKAHLWALSNTLNKPVCLHEDIRGKRNRYSEGGFIYWLPVPLHFDLQSILVLWPQREKGKNEREKDIANGQKYKQPKDRKIERTKDVQVEIRNERMNVQNK